MSPSLELIGLISDMLLVVLPAILTGVAIPFVTYLLGAQLYSIFYASS